MYPSYGNRFLSFRVACCLQPWKNDTLPAIRSYIYVMRHRSIVVWWYLAITINHYEVPTCHALGTNAEIEENELGLTSRACAANFCTGKDSLDMWLDIEWFCHAPEEFLPPDFLTLPKEMDAYTLPPILAGLFCTLMGIVGFLLGFCLGIKSDRIPFISEKRNAMGYSDPYAHEKSSSTLWCFGTSGSRRVRSSRHDNKNSYIHRSDYSQLPEADAVGDTMVLTVLGGYHTQS